MQSEEYYKYVVCPKCQIGGYDLCPECLGAGGFTISISEPEANSNNIIPRDKISRINKQIDLISTKDNINHLIQKKLDDYFRELSESHLNKESVNVIKRILKIKRRITTIKLIKKTKSKLKNIKEIVIDCEGNCFSKGLRYSSYKSYILSQNDFSYIPYENDYFLFTDRLGFIIKFSKTKWISVEKTIFTELITYLQNRSLFDFESNEISYNSEFIKNIESEEYKSRLVNIIVYDKDFTFRFLVEENNLKNLIRSFFTNLNSRGVYGWFMIEPFE